MQWQRQVVLQTQGWPLRGGPLRSCALVLQSLWRLLWVVDNESRAATNDSLYYRLFLSTKYQKREKNILGKRFFICLVLQRVQNQISLTNCCIGQLHILIFEELNPWSVYHFYLERYWTNHLIILIKWWYLTWSLKVWLGVTTVKINDRNDLICMPNNVMDSWLDSTQNTQTKAQPKRVVLLRYIWIFTL